MWTPKKFSVGPWECIGLLLETTELGLTTEHVVISRDTLERVRFSSYLAWCRCRLEATNSFQRKTFKAISTLKWTK